MGKEYPSFLNKVNSNLNGIRQDISKREAQLKNEDNLRWEKRNREEQEHQEKIESTKKEFNELGVVSAFREIINNKFLFISDKPIIKYEPIYNFFGKKTGTNEIEIPNYIPAFVTYNETSISLNIESREISDGYSDNPSYVDLNTIIDIEKIENDRYKIGCFYQNDYTIYSKRDRYKNIKTTVVEKNELLDSLSKIVAVYKESFLIEKKVDSYEFRRFLDENLLPYFP